MSYRTHPAIFQKILDQSVNKQRLGFVWNSNCPSIPNEILENGAGRNASGRLFCVFDQYQWKIRLHYLAMGTGQTKILSHWRAKKNSLPHGFFTHCKIRNNFFSRFDREKKKKTRMTFLAAVKSETRIFSRLPQTMCSSIYLKVNKVS